jgi:putative transposase
MKTYKFKLYNDQDAHHLHRLIDLGASIYNHCIALHKRYYQTTGKFLSKPRLQKHIAKWKTRHYHHWSGLDAQAAQNVVERIDRGYQLFFNALKRKKEGEKSGGRISPPSFKKRRKYKSITFKQTGYKFHEGNVITIQKMRYRYHKSREIEGTIKTLTVKRNPLGELFIYVVTDHIATSNIGGGTRSEVGVDFGLKTYLTLSDGTQIEAPSFYKQGMNELAKANRNLARKKKGSANWVRAKKHLIRVHERIAAQRKDWHFKLARELCLQYKLIVFEDLNLSGMVRLWGRKVSDLGFYSFLRILESQAAKMGTEIVYINRFFPSSKMCSKCGAINDSLNLRDRSWTCECGETHDRDLNASRNILRAGIESKKRAA